MNKLVLAFITAVSVVCFTALAFAGSLAPGASTTCTDAHVRVNLGVNFF